MSVSAPREVVGVKGVAVEYGERQMQALTFSRDGEASGRAAILQNVVLASEGASARGW